MEPIAYYYDTVNRSAIVVKPRQPLFDWINSIYPDSPVEATNEGTVYLVKERNSVEELEKWLKHNYDDIFINELNDWHTDENDWPQKRTYQQFKVWFDVEVQPVVLDLEESEIRKY
ncbi:MAG TPA: hypothetical protein VG367_12980 [Mucilaginibacter sp.]|jgi:hypothetical protein|nr:hypothetical protein [Mucilaginibacter sp.]